MTFGADLMRFANRVKAKTPAVFNAAADAVYVSITKGSTVSDSHGQPVDTGFLLSSWQDRFEGPTTRLISTNVAYAPVIEDNKRAAYDPKGVQRPKELEEKNRGSTNRKGPSTVGGHHSVKLTRAAWTKFVVAANKDAGF